ncbi:class I SAM-dependent methyltransferase [Vineibacter terrae]|uniref:Class I SAM-dependent methyltransferase n=1 Tax=Vineibacter terrae TaxID=2586908 RepID=A0A5C8PUQ3_9HYPH|nr:class I SAM-dependent methyltransferase [Vineibacter terrae]TXL81957.1 class I SAM-dependent methyltransferase [Vineibacter terrae]
MATLLDRVTYAAGQTARVGWFLAHYAAGRRQLKPMPRPDFPVGPFPDRQALLRDMRQLFEREWRDIAAGLVPRPPVLDPDPVAWLRRSAAYFRDLRQVDQRRHAGVNDEPNHDPAHDHLPRYYRQNFHYQSGGWLTGESAEVYDTQVETLFTGAADVMRRRTLKPIATFLDGRDQRAARLLDVGTGTGRLPGFIHHAFPGLRIAGLDLSRPYLDHARRTIGASGRLKWVEGAAEALPFADASVDIVTSSFLFHELPKKVRSTVVAEIARVLKPDGQAIIVDSALEADLPAWKGLFDLFPYYFHEPYFTDWVTSDPDALFAAHGLTTVTTELAFLSRVMVFSKDVAD